MKLKRIKAIGKLLLLFGLPLSIVLGIFSAGVYYGVQKRYVITSFERDWLGLDVEVPPAPEPAEEPEPEPEVAPTDKPAPATPEPSPASAGAPDEQLEAGGASASPPADPPRVVAGTHDAAAEVTATLTGPLAERFALPLVLRVKVVVDDELVAAQPAWIDYVQRTVSQASRVYQQQFGVELELVGVGRWAVAGDGMDASGLLHDLTERPREAADVLLGFTGRPLDGTISGQAETPEPDSPFNGAYGVIYATSSGPSGHLRTVLHEVSHLFGARDIIDASDPAYVAGSWMSYGPARPGQAPWIDAENRKRVLERKDRPFRPASEPASPEETR